MKLLSSSLGFLLFLFLLLACSQEDPEPKPDLVPVNPVHQNYLENPSAYEMKWKDNFDELNQSNWTIGLKDSATGDMVPAQGGQYLLNDNYAGYITEEDSYVLDGALYLSNQKRSYTGTNPAGNYDYTSGWVMSMHKLVFNGTDKGIYLEVRAKFPTGDKVWPAIWLIPESIKWPPEIDVWEYFGKFFEWGYDEMYMRYIHGHYTNPTHHDKKISNFDKNYKCEDWHTYGFQWSSEKMIWSIDGAIVHTLEKGSQVTEGDWPDEQMYVVMNNGVLTVVPDENTTWPNHLIIDYISLYNVKE